MRAALLHQIPGTSLEVADVPEPPPLEPDQLLVRVDACGICGTDLHVMEGKSFRPNLPFVLGHEPVGTVVEVGSAEFAPWLGVRVTATIFVGCGQCRACKSGAERLCLDMRSITGLFKSAGGYAEYLVLRASQAVEVPSALTSETAASLADAGPTAVNAARTALTRNPSRILVVGAGPVGFLVAELLRMKGHVPTVVEYLPLRREALFLEHSVASSLQGIDFEPDVLIDCSAGEEVAPWALEHLAPRGVFVVVGFQTVPQFELIPVVRKELAFLGIRSGSREDLIHILDLAATRRIRLPEVATWPLEGINEALTELWGGRVRGKAVVQVRPAAEVGAAERG
jgi:propanol-preferring alcohol dehydrogenase